MLDIAVIGGGPAGLTAGLYGARGGASVAVFESLYLGGQASITHWIENFPGFPEGISGAELGERLAAQAKKFGANVHFEEILSIDTQAGLRVQTGAGVYPARCVIFCTGAAPRRLGLPQEKRLEGMGVSYCATCDGAFFRNRPVAVIGGGDTAAADALFLARMCSEVHLIHRRGELRAAKRYADAVLSEPKVTMHWHSVAADILGSEQVEGIALQNTLTQEKSELRVDAVFVAVGIEPRVELVKGLVTLGADGGILTDEQMRTSVAGLYAAGDVRSGAARQNVTAAADGAIAAIDALLSLHA